MGFVEHFGLDIENCTSQEAPVVFKQKLPKTSYERIVVSR